MTNLFNKLADLPAERGAVRRYGVAMAAVAVGVVARVITYWSVGARIPYATFFPAVLIAALYGGSGPGLLALGLSLAASQLFMTEELSAQTQVVFAVTFIVVNLLNVLIVAAMRRARSVAELAEAARRQAEGALGESESRFRAMADSAPVLLWIADEKNQCVWFNQRWLEFVGRPMEKELGSGWQASVHPDDLQRVLDADASGFATRRAYSVEFRLRRADGEYRWVLDQCMPMSGSGRFSGYIGSCVDITERKLVEQERASVLEREQAARLEAERTSRIKDEFLATLSHELRTPLNAILGWSQIIRPGISSTEEVAEGLAIIQRNARMQTQIISDLLDMSRIISGKIRLELQLADLSTVIDAAIESVQPSADVKGIGIVKTIDTGVPPILGDPSRLQQAVWNLLTNAIKFTPRNGRVQVELSRTGAEARITVVDNGQGIGPEFLPHIFERFRQADASTTRSHGGLGIGLSIVKNLVELHGGTAEVASEGKGKGATFTLTLPIPQMEENSSADAGLGNGTAAHRPSLHGVSVLIVDDEDDSRDLIGRLLREHDATVHAVATSAEALSLLEGKPVDVLVSDIGMPQMDGYDLIREVRSRGLKVPAMALTAFARREDRDRCLSAGYQAHVAKPVDVHELVTAVAGMCRQSTEPRV